MIKNRYTKGALCIMLAASMLLSGCTKTAGTESKTVKSKSTKSVHLETGDITQNSIVMKIGETGVKYEEVLNYSYLLKNQYEGSFGKALWSYKIDDDTTIGDKAKKEIVSMITQLKIIGENAAKQGITLDGDEKDQALQDAEKLVKDASSKDRKKYALNIQNVQGLFEDNILANKMFYVATDAADTNVTDDEAKQIKIQYLELITKGTDKNGRKINMSVSDKAKTFTRIKGMLKEAKKAESFSDYAEANTDSSVSEATIGKDTKLLDKEAIDAAFSLKKGKMSNIIGGQTGYYIIYCVDDNDEDATYAKKEEIINERQTKMFKEKYSEWLSGAKVDISNKFWEVFTIS
ncbi:peptidyl-prolyl cis-trans isomerase [Eubacterium sp. MSJ-13]|uniref:peptidylprolyl isomerase n=1 Tax=Eubacterium sp. MSJ-13 TaxID=2841513 RepID=UPI001C0F5020|nr:peptidyl-prolyl cis-trans isomerase [Eubacterium sp. MSJ-13]MBU5478679.1 peptidyl-prolyl cis-trans isomerase [Eubacterium sp. MSJ-13]